MNITDADIRKICSLTIYNRGIEYFDKGRVHIKKRDDDLITASVDDDKMYNTRIQFDENGTSDFFCTCAYFSTMGSPCKHIAATLMQRMAELNNTTVNTANEHLCRKLCDSFHKEKINSVLSVHFDINISTVSMSECIFSVAIKLAGRELSNISSFLSAYAKGEYWDFRKKKIGKVPPYTINQNDSAVLDILHEYSENIAALGLSSATFSNSLKIGATTLKRIINIIPDCSYTVFYNGISLGALPFLSENPDILIDITATDTEITLYAGSYGTAVVPDGSVFYYENNIYLTDEPWRKWFMPVYNALFTDCRTQLSFTKDTAVDFAAFALPVLSSKPGVITSGIETSVISVSPEFSLYLDSTASGITCAVKVSYGNISFTLPYDTETDKIIIRDTEAEEYIMWQLSDFEFSNGKYKLSDEELIFIFIKKLLPELKNHATIHMSESFMSILPKSHKIRHNISYSEKIDLLESSIESDLSTEEILNILNAIKLKRPHYRLNSGEFFDIEAEKYQLMTINGLYRNDTDNYKNVSLNGYGLMYLMGISDNSDYITLKDNAPEYLKKIKNIKPNIPKHLKNVLRDYQKEGLRWLKQLSVMNLGGILADDMGLGKTLQLIAFVMSEKRERPSIVICPSSLVYNWYKEIQKFTPEAKTLIIDGSAPIRKTLIGKTKKYDFIITSYAMIRRDFEEYSDTEFEFCIIDEAQNIKNAKSLNAKSVKTIRAKNKFALTGTPVENSLSELWSVFDFCNPGYLEDYQTFRQLYETPIMNGETAAADTLRKKISPFMLRRMKKEVLDELPEKIENTLFVNMTEEQTKMYVSFKELAKNRATILLDDTNKQRAGMEILTLLLRLRQICCHPSLFDSAYKYSGAKTELLKELIENAVLSGHRILIFSQFTSMLGIIQDKLCEWNYDCFRIDGSTPSEERTNMAERFNNGEKDIFLISLKAGGTGLNLTGADMVIHFDPWWNPAVMDQASDRAYRIGQKRAVQIIKLAAKDTIEEKILQLQEQKKAIADDIITSNNNLLKNMTSSEILELFE